VEFGFFCDPFEMEKFNGTMVIAAAAVAAVPRNFRLEIEFVIFMCFKEY
jgi:hypothetical protein